MVRQLVVPSHRHDDKLQQLVFPPHQVDVNVQRHPQQLHPHSPLCIRYAWPDG